MQILDRIGDAIIVAAENLILEAQDSEIAALSLTVAVGNWIIEALIWTAAV